MIMKIGSSTTEANDRLRLEIVVHRLLLEYGFFALDRSQEKIDRQSDEGGKQHDHDDTEELCPCMCGPSGDIFGYSEETINPETYKHDNTYKE